MAHGMHDSLSKDHEYVPAKHGEHTKLPEEYCPAAHVTGVAVVHDTAPSMVEVEPGQRAHSVDPDKAEYVPTAQIAHESLPDDIEYIPARHGAQTNIPE